VALLALDLFSRIEAMWIDARPPFSALLTLWLSMIAALGLAIPAALGRRLGLAAATGARLRLRG